MNEIEAVYTLHSDLPREAPGSDSATRDALRRLPTMCDQPTVWDVGCGPGRSAIVLAQELQSPIIALDVHAPYLQTLAESARRHGVEQFVETRCGSMAAIDAPEGSIDLIWAEGSIYNLGFSQALRAWRRLLRDPGFVVATEATWLTDDPPDEARRFWNAGYPAMTDREGNRRLAAEAGFDVLDDFTLPQSAWWDEYLAPLEQRMATLEWQAEQHPALAAVIAEAEKEIDICRRFGDAVGYVFYLMRAC